MAFPVLFHILQFFVSFEVYIKYRTLEFHCCDSILFFEGKLLFRIVNCD